MNTFHLSQEFIALDQLLNEVDENTGEFLNSPEDIKEYIDKLELDRGDKLDSIERLKRDNVAKADAISAEIKRLQAYKNQIDKTNGRLVDLQFTLTGGNKVETSFYKFGSRRSSSVSVYDEALLPSEYVIEKTTTAPDKKAIKEALNNGVIVTGAEIVTKTSLSVK